MYEEHKNNYYRAERYARLFLKQEDYETYERYDGWFVKLQFICIGVGVVLGAIIVLILMSLITKMDMDGKVLSCFMGAFFGCIIGLFSSLIIKSIKGDPYKEFVNWTLHLNFDMRELDKIFKCNNYSVDMQKYMEVFGAEGDYYVNKTNVDDYLTGLIESGDEISRLNIIPE